jgi:hypothetical protein
VAFDVVGFALDEALDGGHDAPAAAYFVLTLPVSSHWTPLMTLFLFPLGLPSRLEYASIMMSIEPLDCSCGYCEQVVQLLSIVPSGSYPHIRIIERIADVQEHGLAGGRVRDFRLETAELLSLLLPSSWVAVVRGSAHMFQRLWDRCCSNCKRTSFCRS